MAEQKDIYYDGRIYQQVPDGMSRYNYGSVHVDGKHSFVNMQAIIEGKDYETGIKPYSSTTVAYDMTWMNKERICPSCKNNQTSPDHNCDICNGIGYYTPPDELDKDANELVEKFAIKQKRMNGGNITNMTLAKQCAIIHVQGLIDENDSMFKMAELHMDARAIIVLSERLSQLNTLKQKIEAL